MSKNYISYLQTDEVSITNNTPRKRTRITSKMPPKRPKVVNANKPSWILIF